MDGLLFALLEIDDTIWSFEPMLRTIDTTHAGDSISLCVLCVSLADCIEIRSTSINLISEDQYRRSQTTNTHTSNMSFFTEQ